MAEGPTTRRRLLGAELRKLRSRSGLTLEDAGKGAGVSRATVNRYESPQGAVKWAIVDALCRAYGATDDEREAVVALAKTARVQGWWKTFGDAVPETIVPLLTLEDEAVEVCHWCNSYVPGLLQTRAYATAVLQAAEMRSDEDEIAVMADVRMKRQEILERAAAPHLWVIMDEAVIRRKVGGPAVMAEQLQHLHTSAQGPNVTLQVLPFAVGAHPADSSSFMILRGPEPSLDVVHLSNRSGALYLDKPADLELHRLVFEYLRSQALSAAESSEMIAACGEQFAAEARARS